MNHIDDHFDEMTGLLYLEGELDGERSRDVSGHLASCAACSRLLRALESEGVWLREALAADEEPIPAHLIAAPQHSAAHWGWIAAFGLVVGGAYTLWSGFVEPWVDQAAQAGFTQGNLLTMLFFSGAFWKGWDAMQSFMEFLAVATVGMVVIWLLRKQLQRFVAIGAVMGAFVCALLLPAPAHAVDVQHGDPSYTLPAGQEVKTDLIVTASRTRIDGDVDGDLIVWSQSVVVNGHVKGDILGMAQHISLNGPVDGNVRVWCQVLALNSSVARNVMAWAQTMEMDEKATVVGTMMLFSGTSEISGNVSGDLLALSGDLDVNGALGHDATIRAERLTIGPGAEIKGMTKFTGRNRPNVSASAKLASPIQITLRSAGSPRRVPDYASVRYYWRRVLLWGVSFLFGLALLLIAPAFFFDVVQTSKRVGPSIGFGALFLIATPIAAVIVCLTIVGLSVGIAALLLYAIAVYSAHIFIGAWVGEKLLGAGVGVGPAIGRLAMGLAILSVLGMIPFAGGLIGLLAVIWGLGALILAIHRHMSPHVAVAA
jgi:cytoskeletal protein CcmA (bactofilin family)/anti-sigma factor RsiW